MRSLTSIVWPVDFTFNGFNTSPSAPPVYSDKFSVTGLYWIFLVVDIMDSGLVIWSENLYGHLK